jgi:hypothetical protein
MPYPTPAELEALYAEREHAVASLARKLSSISLADIDTLDRLGRGQVAADLWWRCDTEARQALLNDSHAHVRSTAVLANQRIPSLFEIDESGAVTGTVMPFCSAACLEKSQPATHQSWRTGESGVNDFGYTPHCEECGRAIV